MADLRDRVTVGAAAVVVAFDDAVAVAVEDPDPVAVAVAVAVAVPGVVVVVVVVVVEFAVAVAAALLFASGGSVWSLARMKPAPAKCSPKTTAHDGFINFMIALNFSIS